MTANEFFTIVIPVRNEAGNIQALGTQLTATLATLGHPHQVLFVNDASTDGTVEELQKAAKLNSAFRVITLPAPSGQSLALQAGFDLVRPGIVGTMDADLENNPADFALLFDKLTAEFDLVVGWRQRRQSSRLRRLASNAFAFLANSLSRVKLHDGNCPLRLMRTEVVSTIRLQSGLHRYLPVLADLEGFRVAEVPIRHQARRWGKSKYTILGRVPQMVRDYLYVLSVKLAKKKPIVKDS